LRDAVDAVDDRAGVVMVSIGFGACDADVVLSAAQRASTVAARIGVKVVKRGGSLEAGARRAVEGGAAGVESVGAADGGLAKRGVFRAVVKALPFAVTERGGGVRV
jgi:hypothetical protein